ncbi:MAG: SsrA-binding protein SmpB [bacterium]|nr:SsrA-binding protein SmpB [bacterium]
MPTLAINKKAMHEYEILHEYEAGIVLSGPEVKSVRGGHVSLKGSFAVFHGDDLSLLNAHISAYKPAALKHYSPDRSRALLLHARELSHLKGKLQQKGLTLIPLRIYTKGIRIKVAIGLGRGRQQYEKREILKKRDVKRTIQTALKRR